MTLVRGSAVDVVAYSFDMYPGGKVVALTTLNITTNDDYYQATKLKYLFEKHFLKRKARNESRDPKLDRFRNEYMLLILSWGRERSNRD